MNWITTVKLGKAKIIDRLNRIGITFPDGLNYLKLCSLLYQYLKSINNWLIVLQMEGEPLGLTAELQNRYERKATLHSREGKRLGRLWLQQGIINHYFRLNLLMSIPCRVDESSVVIGSLNK